MKQLTRGESKQLGARIVTYQSAAGWFGAAATMRAGAVSAMDCRKLGPVLVVVAPPFFKFGSFSHGCPAGSLRIEVQDTAGNWLYCRFTTLGFGDIYITHL